VHAPFVRGDLMTRQRAMAHWLCVIASGEAEVVLETPDISHILARMREFFGMR